LPVKAARGQASYANGVSEQSLVVWLCFL